MNLLDLIQRTPNLQPWAEGEKIPWNDPAFSQRMLKEHLTQAHDAASRRTVKIKQHVAWIDEVILAGQPAQILDLGCGPGLYASKLATRGHTCRGIDFSPASVEYAVKHAPENCSYTFGDVRTTDFGSGYDLVMLIFGEFNVFKPAEACLILQKACAALKPGGKILLEVHLPEVVEAMGNQPSTWYSAASGLFSAEPHLCLMETFWDAEKTVATERFFIIDAASGEVTRYAASTQSYDEDELTEMLETAGFENVEMFPSLTGKASATGDDFFAVCASRR
jgi:2-polyprenyl-3-methyl-5-hydroxy-6-metoxy-1,4-benzoquinol methylase